MVSHLLDLWLGVAWESRGGFGFLRHLLAALSGFAFALLASAPLLSYLRRRKALETQAKGDAPRLDELHAHKAGTPTFGGILIFGGAFASAALWGRLGERALVLLLAYVLSLGLLGFADDATKLASGRKGLSARAKLRWQFALSAAVVLYLYFFPLRVEFAAGTSCSGWAIFVPLAGGVPLELGFLFVPLAICVLVGATNAANLTDGLDGLAAGTACIAICPLFVFAWLAGGALGIAAPLPAVEGAGEVALFLSALFGGTLGFLWLNCHPAQIFMGDTGSLPLGGALGLAAVLIGAELILLVAGAVLVAEALSVILQVASFRTTGKRIFLIAPLHHHFQYKGWPETKVTVRFWIAGILGALVALFLLRT